MSLVSGGKLRPYETVAALAAGYSVSVAEKIATAKRAILGQRDAAL